MPVLPVPEERNARGARNGPPNAQLQPLEGIMSPTVVGCKLMLTGQLLSRPLEGEPRSWPGERG
jgi:hypothetical protein